MLVTSIFSCPNNVFRRPHPQLCSISRLFAKEANYYCCIVLKICTLSILKKFENTTKNPAQFLFWWPLAGSKSFSVNVQQTFIGTISVDALFFLQLIHDVIFFTLLVIHLPRLNGFKRCFLYYFDVIVADADIIHAFIGFQKH